MIDCDSDQIWNRLAVLIDEVSRATVEIWNFDRIDVDAERSVQRGEDFLNVDRARYRDASRTIGFSEDLAAAKSASCQQNGLNRRPVIATAFRVDARRPAKFSPDNDRGRFEQSSFIKILEKCRQRTIENGKVLSRELLDRAFAIGVPVPRSKGDGHATHACFDKPSCQQQMLRTLRRSTEARVCLLYFAVTLTNFRVFRFKIQRLGKTTRTQQSEGLLLKAVEAAIRRLLFSPSQRAKQIFTVSQSVQVDPVQHEIRFHIACQREGDVSLTGETWP